MHEDADGITYSAAVLYCFVRQTPAENLKMLQTEMTVITFKPRLLILYFLSVFTECRF